MKIVIQHHIPLPVQGYGGTERIVFWHMKELARLGHEVVFIGPSDSKVSQHGIKHIVDDTNKIEIWQKLIPKDADIVHLNYNYTVPGNIPTINTVHGNAKPGEVLSKNSVFVSKAHALLHSSEIYIHNALNFSEYSIEDDLLNSKLNWDNFLFLAKASWKVKNLKDCVEVCRTNHKHLHIAGGRWWGLSRYIHSYGIVGGDKKNELLSKCDALLFPVRWPEPFGIAVIEAMAYGVPVIGSNYGSLPELISNDVGLIAKNKSELNEYLKDSSSQFNRKTIRSYVESRFAISDYSKKYLDLYSDVIARNQLNKTNPKLIQNNRAEDLLPF